MMKKLIIINQRKEPKAKKLFKILLMMKHSLMKIMILMMKSC